MEWKSKDPIARQDAKLLAEGICNPERFAEMDARIAIEVREAFEFAESSPFPEAIEGFRHVFLEGSEL